VNEKNSPKIKARLGYGRQAPSGCFQQESREAGLPKMDIRCQRFRYPFLLHQHKGDAIGEAPILVGTCAVKIQGLLKEGHCDRAEKISLLTFEFREQLQSSARRPTRA
jgi:hypothetical protein